MIPNKSNFKFQELTPITGVKPYVIRFWETEFSEIAPIDSEGGQKIYSRSDVEVILRIKKLLFDDKMTIPEARMKIQSEEIPMSKVEVFDRPLASSSHVKFFILKALDVIAEIKAKRSW
jgi:DNA-binding transcriptional MerR regulator